jgi:[ribosomal protein S18]-alanine N-acetyltransferase
MSGLLVDAVGLPLAPEMAELLGALHARCFVGAPGAQWSAQAIGTILAMPATRAWLSSSDGQPGGLLLARAAGDDSEILTFGVLPARRRTGQGRALLHAAAQWSQSLGLERIVLEVAMSNDAARNLYASYGFIEAGRRKGYYSLPGGRVDALVLTAHVADVSDRSQP